MESILSSPFTPAIIGVPLVIAWIAFVYFVNRSTHPKVLFSLFMVELWERFSYYGMRAFLVLYLSSLLVTGGLGFEDSHANGIYAAYGALVYLTPILGGYLADRFWGARKAIIWGAILMAAGQFTLAGGAYVRETLSQQQQQFVDGKEDYIKQKMDGGLTEADAKKAFVEEGRKLEPTRNSTRQTLLFLGLSLLTLGNGFFKPNISSMIGKFYQPGDARRDGAFTIFYMGINIGAFIAPLVCGTLAETVDWYLGFLVAGIGMIVGLLFFLYTYKIGLLEDKSDPPPAPVNGHRIFGLSADMSILVGSLLLLPFLSFLILNNYIMDYLLTPICVLVIAYLIWLSFQHELIDRNRMWVIVVLLLFVTVFWAFFELAGGALNIFTDKNVKKELFGMTLKASQFQALNALFIMIFAPIFSYMWLKMAAKNIEPSSPVKFSIALGLLGTGFFLLLPGKSMAGNEAMIPAIFIVALYLAHTLGELALSPVGLSLVTKLAPAKIGGLMMGCWFLSSSFAHQAGKWIGQLMFDEKKMKGMSAAESLDASMAVLTNVGMFAIGSAVILLILSPLLKRWMHGVK